MQIEKDINHTKCKKSRENLQMSKIFRIFAATFCVHVLNVRMYGVRIYA